MTILKHIQEWLPAGDEAQAYTYTQHKHMKAIAKLATKIQHHLLSSWGHVENSMHQRLEAMDIATGLIHWAEHMDEQQANLLLAWK